jgi:hypothetical protein
MTCDLNNSLIPEDDGPPPAARQPISDRRWYGSIGLSTGLHLLAIAILAGWWSFEDRGTPTDSIDSRWNVPVARPVFETDKTVNATTPTFVTAPNQPRSDITGNPTSTSGPLKADVSAPSDASGRSDKVLSVIEGGLTNSNLADEVGALGTSASASSDGLSNGSGAAGPGSTGIGETPGGGFFGVQASGNRIVYVVDSSRSMNHPHELAAKTRFGRVQMELLYSIRRMAPEMGFYGV